MTSRYIRLNRDTLSSIISALDAAERGLAPQMAPQGQDGVAVAKGENPNAKPTQQFPKVGT